MPRCFVIQPFDDGERYDKRYEDVFAPAIKAAGLEPYRVDRDPSVRVPIDEIEQGIRASDVCLAEISTDNPNVWFELGFAIASKREVVMVCSDERTTRFPFDVQHRKITRYSTHSKSDFEKLQSKITARLKAMLSRRERLGQVASMPSISRVEGLEQYEIAGLVAVAESVDEPESGIATHIFRHNMEQAGFNALAATLALKSLTDRQMLERYEEESFRGDPYAAFRITPKGMRWLFEKSAKLTLHVSNTETQEDLITDADIPF